MQKFWGPACMSFKRVDLEFFTHNSYIIHHGEVVETQWRLSTVVQGWFVQSFCEDEYLVFLQ